MTTSTATATLPGIIYTRLPDRAVVTLDRPERRNAIDQDMVSSLHTVCDSLERDPAPLILTGGPDIFAAGADISQLRHRRHTDALAGINSGLFDRIARLPLPTIAAVAGPPSAAEPNSPTPAISASPPPPPDSATPKVDSASWPPPAPAGAYRNSSENH